METIRDELYKTANNALKTKVTPKVNELYNRILALCREEAAKGNFYTVMDKEITRIMNDSSIESKYIIDELQLKLKANADLKIIDGRIERFNAPNYMVEFKTPSSIISE